MIFDSLRIRLVSSDLAGRFQYMNSLDISVQEVVQEDYLTATFLIRYPDYRRVYKYLQRKGDSITRLESYGPGKCIKAIASRPLLMICLLGLFFLTLWIPTRVLFVQVEGNSQVSTQQILLSAENSGICFGASVRKLRSERIKNRLLSEIPQLQWVGVNTKGCVATITVAERTVQPQQEFENSISSVISARDAMIMDLTATSGNVLVKPGDVVKKGQVLISGYTDCGLKILATQAQGDVFGRTYYENQAIFPKHYRRKVDLCKKTKNFYLQIGKKEIKINKDSGIPGMICDKMYTQYYLTLPGGFQLPLGITVETCTYWSSQQATMIPEEVAPYLENFAAQQLTAGTISGQILSCRQNIREEESLFCLTGHYECREMIGRIQYEEIRTYYEQNGRKDRKRGSC